MGKEGEAHTTDVFVTVEFGFHNQNVVTIRSMSKVDNQSFVSSDR
jgi:hypothetical protein